MKNWKRSELKEKAKAGIKQYFWNAFFVSIILGIIGIGWSVTSDTASEGVVDEVLWDVMQEVGGTGLSNDEMIAVAAAVLVTLMGVALVFSVISVIIRLLVLNVVEVGACRFYIQNQRTPKSSDWKEILWGFKSGSYGNLVKIMFLRDLKIFLWSILLIFPGVIKRYEYRMIPYLLADTPKLSSADAFAGSRKLMSGNKWAAFVLELSFFGWLILACFVGALLGNVPLIGSILACIPVYCLRPYYDTTRTELYMVLKD